MTLSDLIERLQDLLEQDETLGGATVLFAHQPSYPLQCGVGGPKVICAEDEEIEELERDLADGVDHGHLTPEEIEEALRRKTELSAARTPIVYLHETSAGWRASGEEYSPYGPSFDRL